LLTALEWFKVNGNSGFTDTELPDEIYQPTLLQLDLEGAFFGGVVTDAFRNCKILEFPNLRDNNFDSIPTFDFLDKEVLDRCYSKSSWSCLYIYRNHLSWTTIEKTVDYFVSQGNNYKYEARDQRKVGRAQEVVVSPGGSFTLTCNEAGSQGICTWYKKGFSTYINGTTYTDNNVTASDTGDYTVLIANDYVKDNDAWPDYGNSFTKPIHVTFTPSTPKHVEAYTSYSGNNVSIAFSKPMINPTIAQADEFTIARNGETIAITGISRSGRLNDIITFSVATPLFKGDTITIDYSKGSIADVNGGMLESFTDTVQNLVRATPNLISAVTRVDGEGITLEFDQYIDPESFTISDFSITGNRDIPIGTITLVKGEIDGEISRKVQLVVDESLNQTDTLYISYTKGSLCALYGAAVMSFSGFPIENKVVASFTTIDLKVIDGTKKLDKIIIKGDMKSLPFELYDDGTNGDEIAGDHTWTKQLVLVDGTYAWEVYNRKATVTYDTSRVTNEFGQIIITITPVTKDIDSMISAGSVLSLGISDGTSAGDSAFWFRTNSIVFIVDMSDYVENNPGQSIEPYLMGLEDDWTGGLAMTKFDINSPDPTYYVIVPEFNYNDVVTYSYRNGFSWENNSPQIRSYTVVGNDTVRSVFGVLATPINEHGTGNTLMVYPNPATNSIFLSIPGDQEIKDARIYNLTGHFILAPFTDDKMIDISTLKPGIYLIEIADRKGNMYRNRFIKIQ
jgi:uncharacterized repeat protein (TIGR02059 family)